MDLKTKTNKQVSGVFKMLSAIKSTKKWISQHRKRRMQKKSQIYSSGGENISYISQKLPFPKTHSKMNHELWQVNVRQKIMPFINFKKQILLKRQKQNTQSQLKPKTSPKKQTLKIISSSSNPSTDSRRSSDSDDSTSLEYSVTRNFKRINSQRKPNLSKSSAFRLKKHKPRDDLSIKVAPDSRSVPRMSQNIMVGFNSSLLFPRDKGKLKKSLLSQSRVLQNISVEEPILQQLKQRKRIRKQSVFATSFTTKELIRRSSLVRNSVIKESSESNQLKPNPRKRSNVFKNYLNSIHNLSNTRNRSSLYKISAHEKSDDSYFGIQRLFKKLSKSTNKSKPKNTILCNEAESLKFFFDYYARSVKSSFSTHHKLISIKHVVSLLKRFEVFRHVQRNVLSKMMEGFKVYHLAPNTEFIREGTLADKVFLVLKGRLQIFSKHKLNSLESEIKLHLTNVDEGMCWGQTQILESQILGDHRVSLRVESLIDKLFMESDQKCWVLKNLLHENPRNLILLQRQFPFFFGDNQYDKSVDSLFCRAELEKLLKVFVSGTRDQERGFELKSKADKVQHLKRQIREKNCFTQRTLNARTTVESYVLGIPNSVYNQFLLIPRIQFLQNAWKCLKKSMFGSLLSKKTMLHFLHLLEPVRFKMGQVVFAKGQSIRCKIVLFIFSILHYTR